jgi:hypothetical protein
MIFERLSLLAVVLIAVSSLFILMSQNWRLSIAALALQYLAVFVLIGLVWPFGLAAVKLVAGWMAGAVLGSAQPSSELVEDPRAGGSKFLFRLLVALLVWVLVFSIAPLVVTWIPLPFPLVIGALLLVGMGLIQLGVTTRPVRVLLGLLTTLSGFELFYGAVEFSVLVAGLLAVVTLGLALVGAFLLDRFSSREEPA